MTGEGEGTRVGGGMTGGGAGMTGEGVKMTDEGAWNDGWGRGNVKIRRAIMNL